MELDAILAEIQSQEDDPVEVAELDRDLSRRWRLERGLLAASNLILDVASHVTAGHFSVHPATYEETHSELATRKVLDECTLGGFRNVLAHEYLDIDLSEVIRWRSRLLETAPSVIVQLEEWMDRTLKA